MGEDGKKKSQGIVQGPRSRLAEVGGVGTWRWRGLPDGLRGLAKEINSLTLAPSFQPFARTSYWLNATESGGQGSPFPKST